MSIGTTMSAWPRGARFVELVAWVAIVVVALVTLTQIVGWTGGRIVAAMQALTPFVLGWSIPLAVIALVMRRWALGGAASVIGLYFVVLAWPLIVPPGQPGVREGATPLRVFESNLLRTNPRMSDVVNTITGLDADVLVFAEYTQAHANVLLASPLAEEYPYRVQRASRHRGGGTAVWSRCPLVDLGIQDAYFGTATVSVQSPQPIIVFDVHPPSPISDPAQWKRELPHVGDLEDNPNIGGSVVIDHDAPRLLIGDFNTSYWHPAFRDLLDEGWHDATQVTHRGFSASWPNDWPLIPPFVRIDHALVNAGLVVLDTADIQVPGSDHQGLLVTVAVAGD